MKMKTKLTLALLLLVTVGAAAQTTRREMSRDIDRMGSNYFAYPGPSQKVLTPAPAGYKPFYISHYGRHGSRYMTDNKYYIRSIAMLDSAAKAGLLTPKGAEVLGILREGYAFAYKRDGDLSRLGGRQHREIAHRMYDRFPELLSQPLRVDARSSTVGRCMISMFNFCWELQGLNPELDVRMDASNHDMRFVVGNDDVKPRETARGEAYKQEVSDLRNKSRDLDRVMKLLFTDVKKAREFVDGIELVRCLSNVANDFQNLPEQGLSLVGIFTREELFDMWAASNAGWLLQTGVTPGSTPMYLRQKEVRDSIESFADRAIRLGEPALTLRFSHDSAVLPLAYLMGLKEAMGAKPDIRNLYKYISVDKLIPMAANIQLVFYRKVGSDDILVKFLLNENETSIPVATDCAPYYHWADVKRYWAGHPAVI